MLKIVIPESEFFNEETETFITVPETTLNLEHSLVSLSKWESHWEKPFISSTKTREETLWYVKAMTLNEDVPDKVYLGVTDDHILEINKYIDSKQSATWFAEKPGTAKTSRKIITAELIYFWMISLNIPFECQHWHLERLITLIKVCDEHNAPKKKMSPRELAQRNRALNEERRKKYQTSG